MATSIADFLTVQEVAERLHVSLSFLYKRTATREIPFFKVGKRALFDPVEVEAWFRGITRRDVVE